MKASIEAPDFADGLKIAAGLTRANSHLLAHGCIFIEATTDGIFVTGGDGESYIRVPCGGEVFEPGDVLVAVHLALVAVLMLIFPFSKLLHAPGVFFSPTRNQVDDPRERRHLAPWAARLDGDRWRWPT